MGSDQTAGQTTPGKDPTPACVYFAGKAIDLHQDPGATQHLYWSSSGVYEQPIPSISLNAFPAATVFKDKIYMAHQGASTQGEGATLRYATYAASELDPAKWSPDTPIGLSTSGAPALAVFNDKLYLAHTGAGITQNYVSYTVTEDGKNWAPDTLIPEVYLNESPSMAVLNGKLYLFFQGSTMTSSAGQLRYATFDGKTWSRDVQVPHISMVASPSVACYDGKLWVGYQHTEVVDNQTRTMWYSVYDGTSWAHPQPMGSEAEPIYKNSSPCLSVTDDTLWVDFYSASGYWSAVVAEQGGKQAGTSGAVGQCVRSKGAVHSSGR